MPLRNDLLAEIRLTIGATILPSLTSASDASDLYEAYLFALVCKAAQTEGASVSFRSIQSPNPTTFVFRTSPGYIGSATHDYGFAILEFPGKPILEVHVGVRVTGTSRVLHECDVCVIRKSEADLCRSGSGGAAPRGSKISLAIEAKFYLSPLGLGLARSFLGLSLDLSADRLYFVMNRSSGSIEKLLSQKDRDWEHNIQPQNTTDETRLLNSFQKAFRDFVAKN